MIANNNTYIFLELTVIIYIISHIKVELHCIVFSLFLTFSSCWKDQAVFHFYAYDSHETFERPKIKH